MHFFNHSAVILLRWPYATLLKYMAFLSRIHRAALTGLTSTTHNEYGECMIDKKWPSTAMVGYIDCSAIGMVDSVKAEQVQAYNVVIFGFANPDGTIPSSGLFQGLTNTVQKIKDMESPGTINLLSVTSLLQRLSQ